MRTQVRNRLESAYETVRTDITEDRFLRYILAGAVFLTTFWLWYRTPNFAGPDEYSRLIQPMKVAGNVVADPSFESLQRGLTDGRALGATFYLYSLVLAPLFVIVLLTGQLGKFAALGSITSRWTLWHAAPAWFWTGAIVLGRLAVALFAVGCVYLMYRLGRELHDRRTGRYAAILLTLSLGFLSMAHVVGEDVPALFFFLLAFYCVVQYVHTGKDRLFLWGTAVGGVAIAFKLTMGVIVFVIGAGFLVRELQKDDLRGTLVRPKLLGSGIILGIIAIYVGMPSVLVAGPEELVTRVLHTTGQKTGTSPSTASTIWGWLALGYLKGLGLPLTVGIVLGVPGSIAIAWRERSTRSVIILLGVALVVYITVFSRWQYIRTHHLLPTFPILILLAAVSFSWLVDEKPSIARPVLALLLISTAVFSAGGVVQYANEPRDQAADWMESNVDVDDTVVVYENSIGDVAAVHSRPLQHYPYPEENATYESNLVLNESRYTEWMISTPEREPKYIQLTSSSLRYLDRESAVSEQYPERGDYIRTLLKGELGYRTGTEFGTRPRLGDTTEELLRAGILPHPKQHEQYVIILERASN